MNAVVIRCRQPKKCAISMTYLLFAARLYDCSISYSRYRVAFRQRSGLSPLNYSLSCSQRESLYFPGIVYRSRSI